MKLGRLYLAIFFSILCMSTASIMIRLCMAPALVIAFYRVLFTAGLAAGIKGPGLVKSLRSLSVRDLAFIMGAGFFLALHFAFWISSLDYTSVSSSVLFTNLQVIFVLILSIFVLKEKPGIQGLLGIIVALAGSFLIVRGDLQLGRLLGDMLALASGLFVAVYFLVGRSVRSRVDTMTYTLLVSGTAALVLLFTCLVSGQPLSGFPRLDWLLFLLMAVGPGLAGHGILNWALKYVKAPLVAVSILGESVGASILAWMIFQEALLWYQWAGGLLILVGIYVAAANESRAVDINRVSGAVNP